MEQKSTEKPHGGKTKTLLADDHPVVLEGIIRAFEKELVENGTVILQGIVNAFWKRTYLGNIVESEFPDIYVDNQLTVVPAHEDSFLPEENPVKEPETFHQARAGSQKKRCL